MFIPNIENYESNKVMHPTLSSSNIHSPAGTTFFFRSKTKLSINSNVTVNEISYTVINISLVGDDDQMGGMDYVYCCQSFSHIIDPKTIVNCPIVL